MNFLQRLTYTAKYRNNTSKSGETDIRLILDDQTLRFHRYFANSRVDASQFRKAEHGTKCFLIDPAEIETLDKNSDGYKYIKRNALMITVECISWPEGPVKASLYGKRGKFLGSASDLPEFLSDKLSSDVPFKKTFMILTESSKLDAISNESE